MGSVKDINYKKGRPLTALLKVEKEAVRNVFAFDDFATFSTFVDLGF